MKVDNVGINVEFWSEKTFEEFKKHFKGKLRGDKIKGTWDKIPKKPKSKPAKVKKESEKDK
jgi:hypothetical protein